MNAGQSTISSTRGSGAGDVSALSITSLTRASGGLLNFAGMGANLDLATNQIFIDGPIQTPGTTPVSLVTPVSNGAHTILPFATVTGTTAGGLDFASVGDTPPVTPSAATPYTVIPFASGNYVTDITSAGPTDVVKVTASNLFTSGISVGAVLISGDGITLGSSGGNLSLADGVLLAATGGATTSLGNVLAVPLTLNPVTGTTDGIIVSNTGINGGLGINGAITNGSSGLTLGGTGTLSLSAPNTLAGGSTLTSGTLVFNTSGALGASTNNLVITGGGIQAGPSGNIVVPNNIALGLEVILGLPGTVYAGTTSNFLLKASSVSVGQALTFSGAFPLTLSGLISGTGGLGGVTVNSSSTLTYAGSVANTYTAPPRSLRELSYWPKPRRSRPMPAC